MTIEGDAFIVAFHEPLDAIGWALHVQLALLEAPWPPELLTHPQARLETCPEGKLLFRGLRVRMAINTGVPTEIIVSPDPQPFSSNALLKNPCLECKLRRALKLIC